MNVDDMFKIACDENNLELAKGLYEKGSKVSSDAFLRACNSGHLELVSWLYSLGVTMDVFEDVFIKMCCHNRLETINLLYNLDKSVIRARNYSAFKYALRMNALPSAKLLYQLDNLILIESLATDTLDILIGDTWLIVIKNDRNLLRELGLTDLTIDTLNNIQQGESIMDEIDEIDDLVIHALFKFNRIDDLEKLALPYVSYDIVGNKIRLVGNKIRNGTIKRLRAKKAIF